MDVPGTYGFVEVYYYCYRLLLGCCTRFSCNLIKWCQQLAKMTVPPFHSLYPIPSSPTGWTNWSIIDVYISKLNWGRIFPSLCIQLFYIQFWWLFILVLFKLEYIHGLLGICHCFVTILILMKLFKKTFLIKYPLQIFLILKKLQ